VIVDFAQQLGVLDRRAVSWLAQEAKEGRSWASMTAITSGA